MKILVIYHHYLRPNQAGGSRFNDFAQVWIKKGHQVTVIASMLDPIKGKKFDDCKGKYIKKEVVEGVSVYRCHVSEQYNRNAIGRLWGYITQIFSTFFAGLLVNEYDILITSSPPLTIGYAAKWLTKLKKKPLVIEVRDLWPDSVADGANLHGNLLVKYAYKFEKSLYDISSHVVTLTPAFTKALVEKKGVAEEKISEIFNGVDVAKFSKANEKNIRKLNQVEGKFIVLYAGTFGKAHNLIQILKTAELLKANNNIHFLLVGDGIEGQMLVNYKKRHQLNNVTFVPPMSKECIVEYYNQCDIGIVPLQKKNVFKTVYPNKIFDFMAAKKPMVLAVDGIAREVVVDKAKAGLYAEAENEQDIADKIMQLYKSPGLISEMGLSGNEYVHTHFNRLAIGFKYLELLKLITIQDKTKIG